MNKFKNQLLLLFFLLPAGFLHGEDEIIPTAGDGNTAADSTQQPQSFFSKIFSSKSTKLSVSRPDTKNTNQADDGTLIGSSNQITLDSDSTATANNKPGVSLGDGTDQDSKQQNVKTKNTKNNNKGFLGWVASSGIEEAQKFIIKSTQEYLGVENVASFTDASGNLDKQSMDAAIILALTRSRDAVKQINVNAAKNEKPSVADKAQQDALTSLKNAVIDKAIEIINSKATVGNPKVVDSSKDNPSNDGNKDNQKIVTTVSNDDKAQGNQEIVTTGSDKTQEILPKILPSQKITANHKNLSLVARQAVNLATQEVLNQFQAWVKNPTAGNQPSWLTDQTQQQLQASVNSGVQFGADAVTENLNSINFNQTRNDSAQQNNSKSYLNEKTQKSLQTAFTAATDAATRFIESATPEQRSSFSQLTEDTTVQQPKSGEPQTTEGNSIDSAATDVSKESNNTGDEAQPTTSSFFNWISSMFRKQAQSVGNNPEAKAALVGNIVTTVGTFVGMDSAEQRVVTADLLENYDPSNKKATNFCDQTIDNKTFNQRFNLWLQKVVTRIYQFKDPNIEIVQMPVVKDQSNSVTQVSMRYNKGTGEVTSALVLYKGFSYYVDPTEFLVNKDKTISIPLFDKQSELTFFDKHVYNPAVKKTSEALLKTPAAQSKDVQTAIQKGTQMLLASRNVKGTITLQHDSDGSITKTAENQIMDDGAKINTIKNYGEDSSIASKIVQLSGADYEIFAPDITMYMTKGPGAISGTIQYAGEKLDFGPMIQGSDGVYSTSFTGPVTANLSKSESDAMQTAAVKYATAKFSGTSVGKLTPAIVEALQKANPDLYNVAVNFYNAPTMIGIQNISIAYDPRAKTITTKVTKAMSDGSGEPTTHIYTIN